MLIRNAEVWGHGLADVHIDQGRIVCLAPPGALATMSGPLVDAQGAALLPGLHDHHIHLAGLAARASSVWCGPPDVEDEAALALALLTPPGAGWLRGIGYHESVMGLPTAHELDRIVPHRPLRIQHRSGRMWLLNSPALDALLARAEPPRGLERQGQRFTGRLFDEDQWLREALGSEPPDFSEISVQLACFGITGITDMSPRNDPAMAAHFDRQIARGALVQRCHLAGTLQLTEAAGEWTLGPAKLHLHEMALPSFDEACAFIAAAHRQQRPVAVHCVSEVELVFTLAVFEEEGVLPGDRVEHASVTSTDHALRLADLGIAVCVQPHFVLERGDRYLIDVEERHRGDLYRIASLRQAGIVLAGGSDAPFASADSWHAIHAAVARTTREGRILGGDEAISPEQALALYLADPGDLALQRCVAPGEPADLVLLDRPWNSARDNPASGNVQMTLVAGRVIHDRIDQPPV
ncbi:MAG: amidohydrolase family protein [Novosphingobium sp.]